ncbi:MAG TPA: YbfB/YjiJ family MFS transporter [Micromonospora sp.]|nr:YbfB/YjiJ family MFS transporter [Micromonospora sp.]
MSVELRSACLLALGVGIGRFAFTPILPLMEQQAGLSRQAGSVLATLNYVGYLIGAGAGLARRRPEQRRTTRRAATATVCLTLLAMPLTDNIAVWSVLRFLAGVAGALLFVLGADDLLGAARSRLRAAWGFGGVGAGIALAGLMTTSVGQESWRGAWLAVAACAMVVGALSWASDMPSARSPRGRTTGQADATRNPWPFRLVAVIYTLEGVGYIIVATFLVAAVAEGIPGRLGSAVWVAVGVMALPSCAAWTWFATRTRPTVALTIALVAQTAGAALPAISTGPQAAALSGVLLGATIIAVPWLALMIGRDTGRGRDVALLTIGYSAGQVLGPLLVAPMLSTGYRSSLLVSAALLAGAAILSIVLTGIPHRSDAVRELGRAEQPRD